MSSRRSYSNINKTLNSKFVSGFSDAEACYLISVTRNSKGKWVVSAKFQFCLHLADEGAARAYVLRRGDKSRPRTKLTFIRGYSRVFWRYRIYY